MTPNFELCHLRYVIAVAEELHFGRAASRLHLSRPALTTRIKELEIDLGYELFVRNTGEVTMTSAGVAFVAEARQAMLHAERAFECGKAATGGHRCAVDRIYAMDRSVAARLTAHVI
jgi:DNA-binding transcriptional LysR family regulator